MGGAFVAVANDSSATWWNPAGLAAGPFVDVALAPVATVSSDDGVPASRLRLSAFSLGTPPLGLSYYRFRVTDLHVSTADSGGSRQEGVAGAGIRSLSAGQLGLTLVQTLFTGVHVGTTLKYVRGTPRTSVGDPRETPDAWLDAGEDLEGGDAGGAFDLDVGVLAVTGAFRLGALVRNARAADIAGVSLERQVRLGAAFDGEAADLAPVMVALDADVRRYDSGTGERRVVAAGAEYWLAMRRVGVRGGARVNTVGARERAATAGVSVAVRAGLFVDGHVAHGDERGWGLAARVSF